MVGISVVAVDVAFFDLLLDDDDAVDGDFGRAVDGAAARLLVVTAEIVTTGPMERSRSAIEVSLPPNGTLIFSYEHRILPSSACWAVRNSCNVGIYGSDLPPWT
jgi:hypothetical protein